MARPAPGVDRALAILDFLAANPTESFTLSEVSENLGINLASMHAILNALASAGYVVRHRSHKTYRLGPSAIAIGQAAQHSNPVFEPVYEEIRVLAPELSLECAASVRLGDELVVIASAGPRSAGARGAWNGQRLALVPPIGTMYMAWASPGDVEAWLARSEDRTDTEREHNLLLLDTARRLGYIAGVSSGDRDVQRLPLASGSPPRLDLDPDRRYPVNFIAAPAFDADGQVAALFNLQGFWRELSPDDISSLGRRLLRSAYTVTRSIHGAWPKDLAFDRLGLQLHPAAP